MIQLGTTPSILGRLLVNISRVVRTVEGVQRPVHWGPSAPETRGQLHDKTLTLLIPVIPHERFVVSDHLQRVLELPAVATVIFEARQIPKILKCNDPRQYRIRVLPAEVRSLLQEAIAAESIFQIRVNLNLFGEF